jgi:RNA polymerase sigma-70 factor (ECF subfamily)
MALSIERELLERARRQDGSALESLIAIVWPEAYRLAVSILRDRGLAEDAAQEACAAIAASLHSLKSLDAFPAWSYRIVVSHALGASRIRQRTVGLDEAAWLGAGLDGTDALDLHEALALLSPLQRATVLLHYYAGYNSAEIAAVMGLAASSVRFHLMRARSALRKALSETAERRSDREVFSDVR